MNYPRLATQIFNTPLAILPSKLEVILSAIGGRFGVDYHSNFEAKIATTLREDTKDSGYVVEHDIAIIGMSGTLVHKTGNVKAESGLCGYDSLRHQFFTALNDPKVKAIAIDSDSPGGHVSGCFELSNAIYGARGTKPVMAILSDTACSAAYAIASAADVVTVPQAGMIGSVGVICAHADMSQRLSDEGVKITLIHFGDRKADMNESMPLSSSAFEKAQSDVNKMGYMFVEIVARNRGMSKKAVRDTQAEVYMGKDGKLIGFADEVLAPEHAFEALVDSIS